MFFFAYYSCDSYWGNVLLSKEPQNVKTKNNSPLLQGSGSRIESGDYLAASTFSEKSVIDDTHRKLLA